MDMKLRVRLPHSGYSLSNNAYAYVPSNQLPPAPPRSRRSSMTRIHRHARGPLHVHKLCAHTLALFDSYDMFCAIRSTHNDSTVRHSLHLVDDSLACSLLNEASHEAGSMKAVITTPQPPTAVLLFVTRKSLNDAYIYHTCTPVGLRTPLPPSTLPPLMT